MSEKAFKKLKGILISLVCILIIFAAVLWVFDDAVQLNNTDSDFITFLDVGQGDSILIKSGEYAALIDTGTASNGLSIAKKLRREGVNKLDVLILTHPHDDHIGSAEFLLSEIPTDYIILSDVLPRDDENARCYKDIKDYAAENSIDCYNATEGLVINIGNFELTVLMIDETAEDENNTSIIIMAENSGKKFLFTGDAEMSAESKLIADKINFDCDVLKVGHHGSNSSSSAKFLSIASPTFSVISCGRNNNYSHPGEQTLERLADISSTVLRTDLSGDIKFAIKDGEIVYISE